MNVYTYGIDNPENFPLLLSIFAFILAYIIWLVCLTSVIKPLEEKQ